MRAGPPSRRRLVLVLAGCALALLVLWLIVDRVGPLPGERRLMARFYHRPAGRGWQELLMFFGALGSAAVAVPTVLIAALVALRNVGPRAALLVGLGAAVAVPNDGLKHLFGPTQLGLQLYGSVPSFPSGHVAYATGLFGAIGLLGRAHGRPEVVAITLLLTLAMGVARVGSYSHLPSDVLAGYLVGVGWLAGLLVLLGPRALRI